jgi:hypothetical protein
MSKAKVAAAFVVSLALSAAFYYHRFARVSNIDVHDGFETRGLSAIWATDRFEPGAVTMQSQFVRAGKGAAKVVLHSRDKFEAGIQGDKDSERAELAEPERLYSREGVTYEYVFSEMLAADFPIVPVRLVIAQWKQYCHGHVPCGDDSPVVAVRYISGVLRITRQTSRHQITMYESAVDLRGKWTDFYFKVRFSSKDDGLIQAFVNGAQVAAYRGITAYPESETTGYANPSLFYFKMGLYRDVMLEPMVSYLDEYRKRQLPD